MKKAKSKVLCVLATLLGALFVLACVAGFAACGDGDPETYRFEAEDAKLEGDESEMLYWLDNDVFQGSYITGFGFIFDVQEDDTASGGQSVGYLAHNNPTATFVINSNKDVSGATLTLGAASCDVNTNGASSVFGLMTASINSYSGASHDILSVNGQSVALSGTLQGSDSVFTEDGLAMSNWGTLTATIDLVKGDNTIVLTHDGAGVNWDYIEIESTADLTMTKTDNSDFTVDKDTYTPSEKPEDEEEDENEGGGDGSDTGSGSTESVSTRFVTGPYDDANEEYYTWDDAVFSGSEIDLTAVEGQDNTYAVTGTSAPFTNDQLAVFWGNDSTSMATHADCEYIATVMKIAYGESAAITVKKYYGEADASYTICPFSESDSDNLFFTLITDVTDRNEGNELMSIVLTDTTSNDTIATYKIVLGTIESTAIVTAGITTNVGYGSLTVEAENAALHDVSGKTESLTSGIMKVEDATGRTGKDASDNPLTFEDGKSVGNFNTSGDQIVFEVYADDAISSVTMTITAGAAALSNYVYVADYDASSHANVLSVNGANVVMSGKITASSTALDYKGSWGTITATISLHKGINYITFTCDGTGLNMDCIELAWSDTTIGVTEYNPGNNRGTLAMTSDATDNSLTLEAEYAGLLNVSSKTESLTSGIMKVEDATGRTGKDASDNPLTFEDGKSVGNFNTSGDQIVFEVYADDAISSVTMTITAGAAALSNYVYVADYDASSHANVLSVNGANVVMSGKITASSTALDYNGSWGTITATISLQKGINYITFTCDGTGLNLDCIELSWATT